MTPRERVAAVAARLRRLCASGAVRDTALVAELLEQAGELEAIRVPAEPVAEPPKLCACRVPVATAGAHYGTCGKPCAPGEETCARHRRATL